MISLAMEQLHRELDGDPFRVCGSCGQVWRSWEDFVQDPGIRLLGLQAVSQLPDRNLLVFEHRCGSSVSVLASRFHRFFPDFKDVSGQASLRGSDQCSGLCFRLADLQLCDRACINARDRLLVLRLLEMKGLTSPK